MKNTANANRWNSEREEGLFLHTRQNCSLQKHIVWAKPTRNGATLKQKWHETAQGVLTCAWNLMEATGLFLFRASSLHVSLRNAEAQS